MSATIGGSTGGGGGQRRPGGGTGAARTGGGVSRATYAQAILRGIGAPVNFNNVTAMLAWMQAEGGSARYNPLNTTQPAPGAAAYNSVGVRNYTSYQQGLSATLQTLRNGNYGGILAALRAGSSPYNLAAAISHSPWGTSGSLVSSILHGWGAHGAPGSIAGMGVAGGGAAGGAGALATGGRLSGGAAAAGSQQAAMALLSSLRPVQIKQAPLSLPTAQGTLASTYPDPTVSQSGGANQGALWTPPPAVKSAGGKTNTQLLENLGTLRQRLLGIS